MGRKASDRDYWMTSYEAKEYGMVDEVLEKNKILEIFLKYRERAFSVSPYKPKSRS